MDFQIVKPNLELLLLVLGEIGGKRRLPIVIGNFEAKAIAIALDNEYKTQRPITHDLFKTLADWL